MPLLAKVRNTQGELAGKMETLGFDLKNEALLESLSEEVVKSSEIEGEILDLEQVRSSVARRLGLEISGLVESDRSVDGASCGKIQLEEGSTFGLNTISTIKDLNILPNPTSRFVHLNFVSSSSSDAQLSVRNLSGQVMQVSAVKLNSGLNNFERDISELQEGIYFLQLNTKEGVVTRRIVKQ